MNIPHPPEHTHPRLFLQKQDLDLLRKKCAHPTTRFLYHKLQALRFLPVNANFTLLRNRSLGLYGDDMFEHIKACALFYLLEEDKHAGNTAITHLFDVMQTVDFTQSPLFDAEDMYTRAGGELLVTIAVVYDWCFALLDEPQKQQMRTYSQHIMRHMEVGYPPIKQGAVTSHSGEAQLMRDIISIAIAFYDEDPDLYTLVAKRLFEEFIPARNYSYASHAHHQGDFYGTFRYQWEIYLAWIYRRMGHDFIFNKEQQFVPYSWLYARLPNGQTLKDGDSVLSTLPQVPYWNRCYTRSFFLAAAYYSNPYLQDEYERCDLYRQYAPIDGAHHVLEQFLFTDIDLAPLSLENLPLAKVFHPPYGGIIARTSFAPMDKNSVVASFKIGDIMFKNHQHRDCGNFQIYYQQPLAIDSGLYYSAIPQIAYLSAHRMEYYRHTIAHNCMVFPNALNPGDNGGQRCDEGDPHYLTLQELQNDPDAVFAQTKCAFASDDISYAGADFTKAYTGRVQSYVRSFAFINTGCAHIPAVVLLYDYAVPLHEEITPLWLLHTENKPVLARDGFTTTNGGKLVSKWHTACEVTAEIVGGDDNQFDVFGKNYPGVEVPGAKAHEGKWRVQMAGQAGEVFCCLTVLYVCQQKADIPPDFVQVKQVGNTYHVRLQEKQLNFLEDGTVELGGPV